MKARQALCVLSVVCVFGCWGCASRLSPDPDPWSPPAYFEPVSYAEIEGMRIAYLEAGFGAETTIVFVHGWSGDIQNWWDQYYYFRESYHVVILDDPGHGKSERQPYFEYTMPIAGKVVVGLMDHLAVERAILVGNSMGGHVVEWVAINHPDRVEKLVLSDAAGSKDYRPAAWLVPWITPSLIRSILYSGEQYSGDDPKQETRQDHSESYEHTVEEPLYLDALVQSLRSLMLDPVLHDLDKIQAPTLLLWGDDDTVVRPSAIKVFEKRIPTTTRYLVKKGGHTPHMDKPAEFNCALDRFINGEDLAPCHELNGQ